MYNKTTLLEKDKWRLLSEMSLEAPYVNTRIRVGASGPSHMSIYEYSKWSTWDRNKRKAFKSCFDQFYADQAVIGWFLHFPKNDGFLDLMTYWKDTAMAGEIVAYSLVDGQSIWLDGEEVKLNAKEGVHFSLRVPHEVKSQNKDQYWACLMHIGS